MKKYIFIGFLLLSYSCSLLEIDEHTGYDKEEVGKYIERVKASLNYLYTQLPDDFTSVGAAPRSCASDDGISAWETAAIRRMNNGAWTATNEIDSYWEGGYSAIRASNLFLESYDKTLLEKYKNEDILVLENLTKYYVNYPYEARFLRAFFHFELAKRYGDIPIITKSYVADSVNTLKKSTFNDVVKFIVEECDSAAKHLPVSYISLSPAETGRATKGAALALKAKALLFLASPLHNPANDLQRWKDAAKASLDVINLNAYGLIADGFVYNALASNEMIFEKRFANSNSFEANNFPMGMEGGSSGMCPTQNLVDAFGTSTGTAFDWNNPTMAAAPFTKRDSRLAKAITLNGSVLGTDTIQIYEGGKNGLPLYAASPTGYYLRKYIATNVKLTPASSTTAVHVWSIFRFAEILLNYAEAMNEAFPTPTYTDATFTKSAKTYLDIVRSRAGLPKNSPGTQAAFRDLVRNERRVELCFEDHRFWDVRRWKIASDVTKIYGTRIQLIDNKIVYTPNQLIETRYWDNKMYLYPIPFSETLKNPNLTQNSGW